jgi:hypothetical protein
VAHFFNLVGNLLNFFGVLVAKEELVDKVSNKHKEYYFGDSETIAAT